MRTYLVVVLVGVLVLLSWGIGYHSGVGDFRGKPLPMAAGHYEVLGIHRAADTSNGEAIYLMLAAPIWQSKDGLTINSSDFRYYVLPRRAVVNLQDDGGPRPGDSISQFDILVEGNAGARVARVSTYPRPLPQERSFAFPPDAPILK